MHTRWPTGTSPAGQPRAPAADNVAVPAQNRGRGHDQPQPGQAPGRQRPGEQRQPRPVRPCQPRLSPRPLAQGHRELMAQHQDLGVLPPCLPPRQAQHRHGLGDDEEDQLHAHKPKIIARQPEQTCPPGTVRVTKPTAFRTASAQVAQVFGTHKFPAPRAVAFLRLEERKLAGSRVPGIPRRRRPAQYLARVGEGVS